MQKANNPDAIESSEIERLRNEVARLKKREEIAHSHFARIVEHLRRLATIINDNDDSADEIELIQEAIQRLTALASASNDGARYQWLRKHHPTWILSRILNMPMSYVVDRRPEALDMAIDNQLRKEGNSNVDTQAIRGTPPAVP